MVENFMFDTWTYQTEEGVQFFLILERNLVFDNKITNIPKQVMWQLEV